MINLLMDESWRHQYTILTYCKMAICRDHYKYKNVHVLMCIYASRQSQIERKQWHFKSIENALHRLYS